MPVYPVFTVYATETEDNSLYHSFSHEENYMLPEKKEIRGYLQRGQMGSNIETQNWGRWWGVGWKKKKEGKKERKFEMYCFSFWMYKQYVGPRGKATGKTQCCCSHSCMAERRAWFGTRVQCSSFTFVIGEVSWPLSSHPLKASAS